MNILDIFYNEFLPEVSSGHILCYSPLAMYFKTNVEGKIYDNGFIGDKEFVVTKTLNINNKEEFDRLLEEYIIIAYEFYKREIRDCFTSEERPYLNKSMLFFLFNNLTLRDYNDPNGFLKRRLEYLRNIPPVTSFTTDFILDSKLQFEIEKDILIMETPYILKIKAISKDGEEYYFPYISFAITDDGIVDFYSMQLRNPDDIENLNGNSFAKKINRYCYKIGEGYQSTKYKNVTSSFVVALNLALAYFKGQGYSYFRANNILINRWNEKRIKYNNPPIPEICPEEVANEFKKAQFRIQYNLTAKFLDTFLREINSFNGINLISTPDSNGNPFLCFTIEDEVSSFNPILDSQFKNISNGISCCIEKNTTQTI